MNAATQRSLTPVGVGAVIVFGVTLLLLLMGVGRSVQWDAPRVTPPLPTAHAVDLPAPPMLQSYAPTWEHPLFSADRKPIITAGSGSASVSLGDLQLTGVILTPTLHMALLGPVHPDKDDDGSKEIGVREGAALPDSSWKLLQVLPRSAIFVSSSGRTELKLPAGAPIDGPAAAPTPASEMQTEPAPPPPPPWAHRPPNQAQAERLQRLRQALIEQQRARQAQQQAQNAQGDH